MNIFATDNLIPVILPFVSLILAFASLIIGLDVIWRVQKHLKAFMFLLTLNVAILVLSQAGLILGIDSNSYWHTAVQFINFISSALFLFAFAQMYKIIRILDSEKGDLKGNDDIPKQQ